MTNTDISTRLFPHGLGIGSAGKGGSHPGLGGVATIGFNPSVELGGPLVSKPQLEMTYTTTTNVPMYVRIEDDTQFLEGNWFPQTGINGPTSNTWNDVPFEGGLLPRDTDPTDGGVGAEPAAGAGHGRHAEGRRPASNRSCRSSATPPR